MIEFDFPLEAWLRLTLTPGLGAAGQRKLLTAFGLPEAVFSAPFSSLGAIVGEALALRLKEADAQRDSAIQAALRWASIPGNHIVTLADDLYPRNLLAIDAPPTIFYAKGNVDCLRQPSFAIVGSRNASDQGIVDARRFAASLSKTGWAIVSGLALGIDAGAHQGALEAGGKTVAVIGTGSDRLYPARNRIIAEQIIREGLILSEFPLGTPPSPANFPRRNRLIAGLSDGVLVIEAARESGSLITARLAAEQGKEVFAVPGSIHSPLSRGCHALIRQGAKLVEQVSDITEEIGSPHKKQATSDVSPVSIDYPDQWRKLLKIIGHAPVDFDTLLARSGLSVDALGALLLELELSNVVSRLPGGRYQQLS